VYGSENQNNNESVLMKTSFTNLFPGTGVHLLMVGHDLAQGCVVLKTSSNFNSVILNPALSNAFNCISKTKFGNTAKRISVNNLKTSSEEELSMTPLKLVYQTKA